MIYIQLFKQANINQFGRRILRSASSTTTTSPQRTCLYDFHVANGGKIVDFAGWQMPVQYKNMSIQDSHIHTRSQCSLFDVSHMMQTHIHGKDRIKFIESLTVTDIGGLKPDTGSLTVFTNSNGGILDDLIVSNTSRGFLYVVSNAGCAQKDYAHLKQAEEKMRSSGADVRVERIDDKGLLAVQGPKMNDILQAGVKFDVKKLPFMGTIESSVFEIDGCRVTRCGYTGEDGVEISVPSHKASELATRFLNHRSKDDPKTQICHLAGLGARDTLRLEAGLCLYGNDIDETRTPIEAGLAWLVSKTRRERADFPGAQVILKQLKDKPSVKRVGLKMLVTGGPSARQHMKILENGMEIGEVTSGGLSPCLKQNIAMGYIVASRSKIGTKVIVDVRGKKLEAEVVKLPFVPTRYYQIN